MENILDKQTKELVAIGASVAANCLPCFKYHYEELKDLNVSEDEIKEAIKMAKTVKKQPDQHMNELIDKKLGE